MPAPPPLTHALLSSPLPSRPYILDIHRYPGTSTDHLLLRHPSPEISIADAQTLQLVNTLKGGHVGNVTGISVDHEQQGAVWSAGKDARVIRWDERGRGVGMRIDAFIRKPLPITALTSSESDHLVIAGTELLSSESHIIYWDTRNTKSPAYIHSSTHSDDITHLSLLPGTATYLPRFSSLDGSPLPERLLLSASTDGLVALSDMRETDEDEAVLCAENWGESIASAGTYLTGPGPSHGTSVQGKGMRVWARSDMDNISTWSIVPTPPEGADPDAGPIQFDGMSSWSSKQFRNKDFLLPTTTSAYRTSIPTPRTAEEEMADKVQRNTIKSGYLIDVVPTLGVSGGGAYGPAVGVGTNDGDVVLQYHQPGKGGAKSVSEQVLSEGQGGGSYEPSAYLLSEPGERGHKDVIRALLHDVRNEAIYTGSEDGVLSGWSLASMSNGGRLRTGDKDRDDDGGDGRENASDDDSEDESEESEIRTESSDGMDVDDDEDQDNGGRGHGSRREEREEGPRNGPIIGAGPGGSRGDGRKEKRKGKRHQPY